MLRNLVVQGSGQWFFVRESREQSEPVPKPLCLVLKTHFLLLVVDDLNDRTHNVREKDNAAEHVADSHENLSI